MKKTFIYYTILSIALLFVTNAVAFEVWITGDKLTLHADQAPLQSILQRLADSGIKIRIDPQLNPKISVSFEDRDIQKALDSILKSLDHALIWESIEGPSGSFPKLAEIQVFKRGKKGLVRSLGARPTFSIVKNPKDGSLFVKDEILLRLKPGISLSEFKRLLRKINGTVVDSNPSTGIYKIRLPENSDIPSIVEQIGDHPGLEKAEPNYAYPIPGPNKTASQTLSDPGPSGVPAPSGAAPIAILDTGLTPDSGLEGFVLNSLDALNPGEPISDSAGHGTQMALIAAGIINPDGVRADSDTPISIIPIRAFDDNGFTSNFNIMRSIDFALNNGARVMSLSWGSEIKSDFLENALEYADSKGLIIVASAGNEPTGKSVYPAAYSSVIGVGALGPDGRSWEKSNYGDFVAVYAPGFATLPVGYKGDPGGYAGTSISTAFVANIIASYLVQNPNATRQEIIKALSGDF